MFRGLIFIFALCFANFANAQTADVVLGGLSVDPSAPLETSADSLIMDQNAGTAIFQGNVIIIQSSMKLNADHVELINNTVGDLSRMIATGNVVLVTDTEEAEAEKADYNIETGHVVMTGDVMLVQGKNAFLAQRMNIDLNAGTATLVGRVRTIFNTTANQ